MNSILKQMVLMSIGRRILAVAFIAALFTSRVSLGEVPALVRGPYLQMPTSQSVVVRWRTDAPCDTKLSFGLVPENLDTTIIRDAFVTDHVVLVEDLDAATQYFYSIGTSTAVFAGGDQDHSFETTHAGNDQSFIQVWALGDSGRGDANARAVRDGYLTSVAGTATGVWLMLGDNAYTYGTDEEYQVAVFDTYPTILRNTPLWPALGNHDAYSSDSPTETGPYYDIFSFPTNGEAGGIASGTEAYNSFDSGNVHFIRLDTADTWIAANSPMMLWLAADLQANTRDWIVAFFHHPPYSKGSHDSDVETVPIRVRETIIPVLEAHGVDLVLSGHSHQYERSFLLDSHYGTSDTLDVATMILDPGDGRTDGEGAYIKDAGPHRGTVFVVNGAGGNVSTAGDLDHPAMYTGFSVLGSVILEVVADQLDARFVDINGTALDWFTIIKRQPIFADGFEAGDFGGWDDVQP